MSIVGKVLLERRFRPVLCFTLALAAIIASLVLGRLGPIVSGVPGGATTVFEKGRYYWKSPEGDSQDVVEITREQHLTEARFQAASHILRWIAALPLVCGIVSLLRRRSRKGMIPASEPGEKPLVIRCLNVGITSLFALTIACFFGWVIHACFYPGVFQEREGRYFLFNHGWEVELPREEFEDQRFLRWCIFFAGMALCILIGWILAALRWVANKIYRMRQDPASHRNK